MTRLTHKQLVVAVPVVRHLAKSQIRATVNCHHIWLRLRRIPDKCKMAAMSGMVGIIRAWQMMESKIIYRIIMHKIICNKNSTLNPTTISNKRKQKGKWRRSTSDVKKCILASRGRQTSIIKIIKYRLDLIIIRGVSLINSLIEYFKMIPACTCSWKHTCHRISALPNLQNK